MDSTTLSLDDQWLHFLQQNKTLFEKYPFMIPVRQELFKSLTAKEYPVGLRDRLKPVIRALTKRQSSLVQNLPIDVLFWIDSTRNVFMESLIPLYRHMESVGIKVGFAVRDTIAAQMPADLCQVVIYRVRFPLRSQSRWEAAWKDFAALNATSLKSHSQARFQLIGHSADANEAEITMVLNQVRPKIVVLAADHYVPNSTVCVVARQLGIRSVVLQHGIVQAFYTPLVADDMIVWGETSLNALGDFGVNTSKLHNLGSPRYDVVKYQHDPHAGSQFRALLGLTHQPVFVFFSNGNDYVRNGKDVLEACADWLEHAAVTLGDRMQIVVRLHPNEDGRLYEGKQHLSVIKTECDSWLSMAGADVIGSLCSTALIEGLLYDKPILQFYADGWSILADNWQRGLAERVPSADGLVQQLNAATRLTRTDDSTVVKRVFNHQGESVQYITDYFSEVIGIIR